METNEALDVFAALSQPTRIDAFRLAVSEEPNGLPAGEFARRLRVPQNTMSTHLAVLERAGLLSSTRSGRAIIYRAQVERAREIASFLVNDCCGGHPEMCGSPVAELTLFCSPAETLDDR